MYDFSLDMNSLNSNSIILNSIDEGSKVLEVGCAHGRMTRYLCEKIKCDITIVEKCKVAGNEAAKFVPSQQVYIGDINGDIEGDYWFENLKEEKFDYIIFADVLEHLLHPEIVLKRSSQLLSTNGKILVSIPNIAHNSVIIDLLNNKFEYREFGLLDKTHIKFFTESSIKQMVNEAGLIVSDQFNLKNAVGNTEFSNNYNDLPTDMAFFLKNRENGEVYQFVMELKRED